MGVLDYFRRKRLPDSNGAPQRYVKGTVLVPGAEAFAYEPTTADPTYDLLTFPGFNFRTMNNYQPRQVFQTLAQPNQINSGSAWTGLVEQGLIDAQDVPNVDGNWYN